MPTSVPFLTGYSAASYSKMALSERVYIPHMAAHGSTQQHQRGQRQALPVLVGKNTFYLICTAELLPFVSISRCLNMFIHRRAHM